MHSFHPNRPFIFTVILLFMMLGQRAVSAETTTTLAPTATTRYVRSGGSDSGSCTPSSSPCATVAYAKSQSSAGDTILVGRNSLDLNGTLTQSAFIDFPLTIEGRFITTFPTVAWVACNGSNCPTFTPPASTNAFRIAPAAGETVTLNSLNFEDASGSSAVRVESGKAIFNNCSFSDNANDSSYAGGIWVDSDGEIEVNTCSFDRNSAEFGGAINSYGIATINSSSFRLNAAGTGGAIHSSGAVSDLSINNAHFQQNSARAHGGAIRHSTGIASIAATDFFTNTAGATGGGLSLSNALNATVTGGLFQNNEATPSNGSGGTYGGGISQVAGSSTISNVEIRNNKSLGSPRQGGGVSARSGATMTIENSTFADNRVPGTFPESGALYAEDSTVNLFDSTMSGHNGAIFVHTTSGTTAFDMRRSTLYDSSISLVIRGDTTAKLINSTISNDTGTGNNLIIGPGSQVELQFSTLINTSSSGTVISVSDDSATNVTVGNSVIVGKCAADGANYDLDNQSIYEDGSCRTDGFTTGLVFDVRLTELGDYGGSTLTHHPEFNSPAINRGLLSDCNSAEVSNEDQRGYDRPFGNTDCDVGAVEYAAAPTSINLQTQAATSTANIQVLFFSLLLLVSIIRLNMIQRAEVAFSNVRSRRR